MPQMLDDSMMSFLVSQLTPNQMAQGQPQQAQQAQIDPMQMMMAQMLSGQGQGAQLPTGAALTNITPELMNQALQFKFTQDQMMQQQPAQLQEMMYKGQLIDESDARIQQMQFQQGMAMQPGQVEQPKSVQEHRHYVQEELAAGREPMPYGDWMKDKSEKSPIARELAFADPANAAAFEAAIRLNAAMAGGAAEAKSVVEKDAYFDSPKFVEGLDDLISMQNLHMNATGLIDRYIAQGNSPAQAETIAKYELTKSYIERLGARIVGRPESTSDGRVKRTIMLPSGKTKEVILDY